MNKKAEAFRKYLKKSGIKSFMMDDMHDRRLNTVIFRTFIEAQGTELPLVLVLDAVFDNSRSRSSEGSEKRQ